jgi:hypothetical protein
MTEENKSGWEAFLNAFPKGPHAHYPMQVMGTWSFRFRSDKPNIVVAPQKGEEIEKRRKGSS